MPRQARKESGTGIFHVMMRGIRSALPLCSSKNLSPAISPSKFAAKSAEFANIPSIKINNHDDATNSNTLVRK